MSLYLTAIIHSKPGMAARLKPLLLHMAALSIEEENCIQYDLHQSTDDENKFIFHEEWKDTSALEEHRKTAHVLAFQQMAKDIIDGELTIYTTQKIA